MKLVIGPAKRQEYENFARRFEDAYIISLIGDPDTYLAERAFQRAVERWIEVLRPEEVIVARSSLAVSAGSYLAQSRKVREAMEGIGVPLSETFYSLADEKNGHSAVGEIAIHCVDGRLNNRILARETEGDYVIRIPGGLAPFLEGDPIACSELDLLATLRPRRVVGNNHQDCRYYAYRGHRPADPDGDREHHRREISRAEQLFRQRSLSFVGDFCRL